VDRAGPALSFSAGERSRAAAHGGHAGSRPASRRHPALYPHPVAGLCAGDRCRHVSQLSPALSGAALWIDARTDRSDPRRRRGAHRARHPVGATAQTVVTGIGLGGLGPLLSGFLQVRGGYQLAFSVSAGFYLLAGLTFLLIFGRVRLPSERPVAG